MRFTINIRKGYFFAILGAILVLVGVFLAYASFPYTSPNQPNPGHGGDKIWVNTPSGEMTLQAAIDSGALIPSTAVCPSTPTYDSMSGGVADVPGEVALTIPLSSSCLDQDIGCVIKQEIYDSNGLKLTRQFSYNQDITNPSNLWWSSFDTTGSKQNGDNKDSQIIPKYASGAIKLADDASSVSGERDPDKWTVRDSSNSLGQKIYVCSYPS